MAKQRIVCRWTIGSPGFVAGATLVSLSKDNDYIRLDLREHVELTNVFVEPAHRRRGWGRKLLRYVTEYAEENNLVVFLRVLPYGEGAKLGSAKLKAFYERFGFHPISAKEMVYAPAKEETRVSDRTGSLWPHTS